MSDTGILKYRDEPVFIRQSHDWYREPTVCVERLFEAVRFVGQIHDPACGGGNIPRTAARLGYDASGSDIVDRGYGPGCIDFLDDLTPRENIVSNPPYVLAERFVLHGLKVANRRVAMLVRLAFLEGQGRRQRLFVPFPPELVLVHSSRPSMPPGDRPDLQAKGGKTAFCWIVWSKDTGRQIGLGFDPSPRIGWLP